MSNVVIYCRVSSDEQAQRDLSIPAQRKALLRWIDDNQPCELLAEFMEAGESAYSSADKRPQFQQMIAFCRKNTVQAILVHKLDRFSRNREESIIFKALLRKHGVQVRSISEPFDPDTPQGMLYEGMIETINQFYSANLATETLKGMRENAEHGWHNGGRTPFAYRLEPVTEDNGRTHSRLVPGPDEEVELVRELFDMSVNQGMGLGKIVEALNSRGTPAPLSKHWNKSSLGVIMKNRVYVGDCVWNKKGKRHTVTNSEEDWVVVKNAHEGIVDREIFEKRQKMAKENMFQAGDSKKHAVKYLLSRLIKCDHCGNNYIGKGSGKNRNKYYRCNGTVSKGKAVCPDSPSMREDWLDAQVIKVIREKLCSSDNLTALSEMIRKKIEDRRREFKRDPRVVGQKLTHIDKGIDNYYRAIAEGLDPTVCKQKILELEKKKEKLEKEAGQLKQEDYYRTALQRIDTEIHRFSKAFDESFEGLPFNIRRQIVLRFIDEIRITKDNTAQLVVKVPFEHDGYRMLTDGILGNSNGGKGNINGQIAQSGHQCGSEQNSEKFPFSPDRGANILSPPILVGFLFNSFAISPDPVYLLEF